MMRKILVTTLLVAGAGAAVAADSQTRAPRAAGGPSPCDGDVRGHRIPDREGVT